MSTLPHLALTPGTVSRPAILDAWRNATKALPPISGAQNRRSSLRALSLLLLLLIPAPNQAHSGVARIPFRTVQSLIVVEGKLNGNVAIFVLDTGANRTIVSTKIYGNARFELQRMPRRNGGAGFAGYSLRRFADVELAENVWARQQVSVMDLDELKQMLHLEFDALLGQDFLRQFHSVRIDYRAHIIELEE